MEPVPYIILPSGGILDRVVGREEEEPEVFVAGLAQEDGNREPVGLDDREATLDTVVSDGKTWELYLTKRATPFLITILQFWSILCTLY